MAQNGKTGRNLINKLFRKERHVRTHQREFDHYDKSFLNEEVIDRENKVERLMRKVARRLERAFSFAPEAHKPAMSSRQKVNVARVVYAPNPSGHAIQLTMANASINEYEGFLPGDIVVFLNGHLKGQNLAIVNVPDASHLLLEDAPAVVVPATHAHFIGQVAGMTSSVTIQADNAGAAGNSISLTFDGSTSISAEILAWNTANPGNTASLLSGNGSQLPNNGQVINLSGGQDGSTTFETSESNITVRININGVKNDYEQ